MNQNIQLYIAGPMSGIIDYNRFNFNSAEKMWVARGVKTIFNPIHHEGSKRAQAGVITGQEAYRECMAIDMDWICKHATHMYMLTNWERSKGARAEHALASALGLTIYYQD